MCGFLHTNLPIICTMMLAPPTRFYTMLSHAVNQTYNAGLNYANKNSSCAYTNTDLLKGYGVALTSSITIAVGMRKILEPFARGGSASKQILFNGIVAVSGSAAANFFNTMAMRYTEIDKGITMYKDEQLTQDIGISKKGAEMAVYNTAISRMCMSLFVLSTPTTIMLFSRMLGFAPAGKAPKMLFDVTSIGLGLYIGLPLSVATFPSISKTGGKNLEEPFHQHEHVYYNRGM